VGPNPTRKGVSQHGVMVAEVWTTHFRKYAFEDIDLVQELIILAQSGTKDDAIESVNPLLPLRPLTTDFEHVYPEGMDEKCHSASARAWKANARELTHFKLCLCNTRTPLSRA
jgi:hypothetical protein